MDLENKPNMTRTRIAGGYMVVDGKENMNRKLDGSRKQT